MTTANVAVVVPVLNRPVTVIEALESVAAQTMKPRVLVVVDDGSTDDTADAVGRWIKRAAAPFLTKLVCQPNQGVSVARNRGTQQAGDCELFAFLDSDDLWPRDFLARAHRAMTARRDAIAATSDQQYACYDDCGEELFRTITKLDTSGIENNASEWLFLANRGITPATVVRADAFRKVGRYDETMLSGEDWKLYLHLSLQGPWLHLPGDAVTVRLGICKTRQEQGHLQLQDEDRYLIWARMIDRFIRHEGGSRAIRHSIYSRRLASWWYALGRDLMRSGRKPLARTCFRRSISWQATFHKSWFRLIRTYAPWAA